MRPRIMFALKCTTRSLTKDDYGPVRRLYVLHQYRHSRIDPLQMIAIPNLVCRLPIYAYDLWVLHNGIFERCNLNLMKALPVDSALVGLCSYLPIYKITIMAILQDIKVTGDVDGHILTEYDDTSVLQATDSFTKHIEPKSGTKFVIKTHMPETYIFTSDALSLLMFVG